jgi:ribosome biogenesis GTPase A
VLDKTKVKLQHLQYLPKVYVMGTTNSGKSSLINAMLKKQVRKREDDKKKKEEPVLLTESALPGTTQEMITVEQFKIGLRVIDTPGIPNMQQVSAHMASYFDLSSLLPRSEMTTFSLNVKSGYSVWLGALARVDFVNGDDKHLTFVVPTDVTIHRTPIARAETVFRDQAGNMLKPSYFVRQPDPEKTLST